MSIGLSRTSCLSRFRTAASRTRVLAIVALGILLVTCSAYGQSVPGFQALYKPKVKDEPIATKAGRGEAPLAKLYSHLKVDSAKVKRLGQLARTEKQTKRREKFLRIGIVRPLQTALDPFSDSARYSVKEGDVRVAGVVSDGAVAIRVHFKGMSLPPGARVFVYSMSNPDKFYGPYEDHGASDDGTFWTPPMQGDGVVIEYFTPAGTKSADAPFKVSEVAHIFRDVFTANDLAGACNLEVTPEWTNVAKSVAMLEFVTGPYVAVCTGTLLNDSNPNLDHYVLTANHCISTQSEAQSAFAYWNYNTGETPPGGTASYAFDLVVTGGPSDFTLLHRGAVPSGLFYSGWDASPFSAATPVTGDRKSTRLNSSHRL